MKRRLWFACIALCTLTLALVVCGCQRTGGDPEGATAKGAEGEHAKELNDTLVKSWFLCRAQKDGLTVRTHDDSYLGLYVKEDGSASISQANGGFMSCRWRATSNNDITFYQEEWENVHSGRRSRSIQVYTPFSATYYPDKNELWVDGSAWGSRKNSVWTSDLTLCFTDEITFEFLSADRPSHDDVTSIEDASKLLGDWKLTNVIDTDMVTVGEADKIAAFRGYGSGVMTLSEGGKGTFLGDEVEWSVNEGVGNLYVVSGKQNLKVEQLPDGLFITSDSATYVFERS